jgi:hypothetical protein
MVDKLKMEEGIPESRLTLIPNICNDDRLDRDGGMVPSLLSYVLEKIVILKVIFKLVSLD